MTAHCDYLALIQINDRPIVRQIDMAAGKVICDVADSALIDAQCKRHHTRALQGSRLALQIALI